jgi:hypothetical protein
MEEGLEGNGEAGSRIREQGMVVVVFWRKSLRQGNGGSWESPAY